MRHRLTRYRINRFTSWRKATVKSLVRSVLTYQSIKTTKIRARMAKQVVDSLIHLAQENTLAGKRRAFDVLGDHALVSKLFGEIAGRFPVKSGGYTRIMSLGKRRGDDADMVILELTEIKKKETKHPKKKKDTAKDIQDASFTKEETSAAEVKLEEERKEEIKKPKTSAAVKDKDKHQDVKKPNKNFLGGLRGIFKKERDSL